jgi:acyl-CoA reductase-like NAD-dependent aldehyde dehydrogenase
MSDKIIKFKSEAAENHERIGVLKTYKLYIDGKFPRTESGRYYELKSSKGAVLANISWSSKKDLRDAVTAARAAFAKWSKTTAYNRGQILYRMAEMMEGRSAQFRTELEQQGLSAKEASEEVSASIDRLIHYAGWSDKYQQIFSSVNPVASSHFNFSILEPTGVVTVVTPESSSLLGFISAIAPVICGGNTVVALASTSMPLGAITFGEILATSDLPAGVINILTGYRKELLTPMANHMDVNAIIYCGDDEAEMKNLQQNAVHNLKRVHLYSEKDWSSTDAQSPYMILDTQEVKTTWHPIGI